MYLRINNARGSRLATSGRRTGVLIHGARAAVLRIKREGVSLGAWLDRLDAKEHKNIVVVAMANKLARIAWAVLSSSNEYRPAAVPA